MFTYSCTNVASLLTSERKQVTKFFFVSFVSLAGHIYIYDDAAAGDELIAYYDYGSSISLANTDTFTIDFDGSAGALTIV